MARITQELLLALPELSKAVFSQPTDKALPAKQTVRPVLLKGERSYQLESFRDNKAFHRNLGESALEAAAAEELEGKYRQVLLVTENESRQYILRRDGSYKKTSSAAALPRPGGEQAHNREKDYILREGEAIPALVDLGVFTKDYKIVRARYDKFKQINRFVELVAQGWKEEGSREIRILDFGCGKSYLTFILYYYFSVKRGMKVTILGYDLKADVVERCGQIAEKYGYTGLRFVHADVSRDVLYGERVDMVVTLHACDTATDYALRYAIEKGADYIFSVPCCQHEINAAIRRGGDLDLLLGHGILKERLSALLTDAIRGKVLEDMGYKVDMIVTLHACDTATDYALRYAIEKGAKYIFSVPCCQHEINRDIRRGGDFDLLLEHGIFKERLSALLTDAIRGKVLEDMGYKVDMIEFTDFDHSPKNLMIRARRTGRKSTKGREEARRLAETYGFRQTLLELCP